MESYVGVNDLLHMTSNSILAIFLPIFLATTGLEAMLLLSRHREYPWRNACISISMAVGHFITQAAAHGLIFGVIATSVYEMRLTTIPVSFAHWFNLIVLFV